MKKGDLVRVKATVTAEYMHTCGDIIDNVFKEWLEHPKDAEVFHFGYEDGSALSRNLYR